MEALHCFCKVVAPFLHPGQDLTLSGCFLSPSRFTVIAHHGLICIFLMPNDVEHLSLAKV